MSIFNHLKINKKIKHERINTKFVKDFKVFNLNFFLLLTRLLY